MSNKNIAKEAEALLLLFTLNQPLWPGELKSCEETLEVLRNYAK